MSINTPTNRNFEKAELQEADGADAINLSDINQMKAAAGNADLGISLLSLKSTIGSSHNGSELDEWKNIIKSMKTNEAEDELFLASGSLENSVVIWDVKDGRVVDKIQFKSTHTRTVIPSKSIIVNKAYLPLHQHFTKFLSFLRTELHYRMVPSN